MPSFSWTTVAVIFTFLVVCRTQNENQSENERASQSQQVIEELARQLLLQHEHMEESVRTSGHSGLKQIREYWGGTKPYYTTHFTSESAGSIHNHANAVRTMGLGELSVVLNGVEFRTRHNDYRLVMPSRTSQDFHAVEDIPLPAVPPEVSNKRSIWEQIMEMREWFKAWKDQDYSVRDYRDYFKANLCYLEGAWLEPSQAELEGFTSFRHFVDADNWDDLEQKICFTAFSGKKHYHENLSRLPRRVIRVENGVPIYAQWNYRMLCHPLDQDLPLDSFLPVDDLAVRVGRSMTMEEYSTSRAARFRLKSEYSSGTEGIRFRELLDDLMEQIPGKNNYNARFTDESYGETACTVDSTDENVEPLNTGFYHRWFKVRDIHEAWDNRSRGYSDDTVFMAMTDHPQVVSHALNDCREDHDHGHGQNSQRHCSYYEQRWTYAIPFEIVYTTPLSNWNPLDIEYKGLPKSEEGLTVEADDRDGTRIYHKAYNGSNLETYYRTPAYFFLGDEVTPAPADTTKNEVNVLDKYGRVRQTKASGHRVLLPNISGIGVLRQRYPIFPVYQEGSAHWKELEALKEFVLHADERRRIMET